MAGLGPVQVLRSDGHSSSVVILWTEDSDDMSVSMIKWLHRVKASGQESGPLGGSHCEARCAARGSSLGAANV